MSKSLQAIRGMNDILPEQTPLWRYFESTVARLLDNYGYKQIRMPIVEFTELFKRSIGEVTDIVEKEMYTFEDRNGDSLTLRPEFTAGVIRAGRDYIYLVMPLLKGELLSDKEVREGAIPLSSGRRAEGAVWRRRPAAASPTSCTWIRCRSTSRRAGSRSR